MNLVAMTRLIWFFDNLNNALLTCVQMAALRKSRFCWPLQLANHMRKFTGWAETRSRTLTLGASTSRPSVIWGVLILLTSIKKKLVKFVRHHGSNEVLTLLRASIFHFRAMQF